MRSPTSMEPEAPSEQEQRAAMMRRLGIVDDTPPEPTGPRLKVVAPAPVEPPAPVSYEQQLEDMLSRFGIEDRPAVREVEPELRRAPLEPVFVRSSEAFDDLAPMWPEPAREEPRGVPAEPVSARTAEFDIPAAPLHEAEAEPELPEPPQRRRAERPAPDVAPRAKPTQEEMLEELRRQFKGSHMAAPARGLPTPSIAIPAPSKAQKRRMMGEMGYTKLVIWLVVIGVCGWLTYVVVKASVEHDKARAQPVAIQTR